MLEYHVTTEQGVAGVFRHKRHAIDFANESPLITGQVDVISCAPGKPDETVHTVDRTPRGGIQ